jgi:hypothetical protein
LNGIGICGAAVDRHIAQPAPEMIVNAMADFQGCIWLQVDLPSQLAFRLAGQTTIQEEFQRSAITHRHQVVPAGSNRLV